MKPVCWQRKTFPREAFKAAEAYSWRANCWKSTFLCGREPWETNEGWMRDGWRETTELRDSLTAEVVCGNLREERWVWLSKQVGFCTTGDSSVHTIYAIFSFSSLQLCPAASLSYWRTKEKRREEKEEGRWANRRKKEKKKLLFQKRKLEIIASIVLPWH